jgi:hypothetical protein
MLTPRTPQSTRGGFGRLSQTLRPRWSQSAPVRGPATAAPPRHGHARRRWLLLAVLVVGALLSSSVLYSLYGAAHLRAGAGGELGVAHRGGDAPLTVSDTLRGVDLVHAQSEADAAPAGTALPSHAAAPAPADAELAALLALPAALAEAALPARLSPASLYTCALGAASFRWAWTPSRGALVSLGGGADEEQACLSLGDGGDGAPARLLGLGACGDARALAFALDARTAQLVAAPAPRSRLAAGFCLHAAPGNTQGEPLQLRACDSAHGKVRARAQPRMAAACRGRARPSAPR